MKIEFKEKTFRLWKYSVSHSELLIRSPKNPKQRHNIDILFYGVKMIKFPTIFKGSVFSSISLTEDIDILKEIGQNINKEDIFIFRGDVQKYYIVASGFNIEENEKELCEE